MAFAMAGGHPNRVFSTEIPLKLQQDKASVDVMAM